MNENIQQQLQEIKEMISELSIQNKEILSFKEASKYLNLSHSTMYKYTSTNVIAHYKPTGKKIFFKKEDLDIWILKNKVSSMEEIEAKAIEYIQKNPWNKY